MYQTMPPPAKADYEHESYEHSFFRSFVHRNYCMNERTDKILNENERTVSGMRWKGIIFLITQPIQVSLERKILNLSSGQHDGWSLIKIFSMISKSSKSAAKPFAQIFIIFLNKPTFYKFLICTFSWFQSDSVSVILFYSFNILCIF